jgi:multisubunit Na+/H+ antiporter MnhB subunit
MSEKINTSQNMRFRKPVAAIIVLALTGLLGWTVWKLPPFSDRMQNRVYSHLSSSGVENPVTAVLLNFRGYDTLLEIGVLLLAAVGVLSMAPAADRPAQSPPTSIQLLLLRRLLPFIILVGGYILWIGKYAPGGAFQAGAILAAGGILLVTAEVRFNQVAVKTVPIALSMGLLIFLMVALATMVVNGNLLQYPLAWAGTLILVIEAAATISIAVILTVLFIGGPPHDGPPADDR